MPYFNRVSAHLQEICLWVTPLSGVQPPAASTVYVDSGPTLWNGRANRNFNPEALVPCWSIYIAEAAE